MRSSSRITRARSRSHLIRQDLVAAPDVLLDLVHGDGRRAREPESEARDAGAQHDAVFLFLRRQPATVDGSAHAARCDDSRDVRRERGVGAELGRSERRRRAKCRGPGEWFPAEGSDRATSPPGNFFSSTTLVRASRLDSWGVVAHGEPA